MFDPVQYLLTVHKDTDSGTFHQGINLVKQKTVGNAAASQGLKAKKELVMSNYI